ncbi:MAG: two-component system, OmpR family, sensor histidine kinase MprB [Frankiaceae bacterium]|jgi:two-component system sensor histidine kinase MprB|nr:two-component system, OmpR family, sensor histidine kinase MprB [Frankiaceae bacterium]
MTPVPPAPWWALGRSLRSRLVAVVVLAVVVAVSGVVGVAFLTVRRELRAPLESQLRSQSAALRTQAQRQQNNPFGIRLNARVGEVGGYVQVLTAEGETSPITTPPVALPVGTADLAVANGTRGQVLRDVTIDGARFRMLTRPLIPGFAVQVALPQATVQNQLRRLAVAFGLLAAAGLALAAGLAWVVSRRALTPVVGLTEAAEQIAATRDLTLRIDESRRDELGRLAASFNTMLAALQQSVGAQRRLVADASHELRTPLASLRTNAEVLRRVDELSPDVREEVVTAIVGQVEELTALVADVVELARGDEPEEAPEAVAFDEVVNDAVDRARRYWPAATFDVETEPVTVRGVARRLERAVTNLLDNAAKFSGPGAAVEVRLTGDGRLTVRDSGPGVPEDALPHVFGRFFRADEARAMPGSGLGLAIVKQTVEAHGGTVSLRNAPDRGTVAEVTLPPGE